MSKHSTNYTNTLILPAADCPAPAAKLPAKPDSIAGMQYAMLAHAPYQMTSDDPLCALTASRQNRLNDATLRAEIFAKGRACLRASPLTKTHGWAVHHDAKARVAMIDPGTTAFRTLAANPNVTQIPAMRNKRAQT